MPDIVDTLTGWTMVNSGTDQDEVMTLAQVAEYLALAPRTVLRMVQRGEIPAAKVASQWRFMRSLVQQWLANRIQSGGSAADQAAARGTAEFGLRLSEVLRPELVLLDLQPGAKEQILQQFVELLSEAGVIRSGRRLLTSLIARERMMTTAIGHGVGLPHPRHRRAGLFAEPLLPVGICRPGTDFQAIDGQPVYVFFLVCAPRDEQHLQLMAKLTWLIGNEQLVPALRSADSAESVVKIINSHFPE